MVNIWFAVSPEAFRNMAFSQEHKLNEVKSLSYKHTIMSSLSSFISPEAICEAPMTSCVIGHVIAGFVDRSSPLKVSQQMPFQKLIVINK